MHDTIALRKAALNTTPALLEKRISLLPAADVHTCTLGKFAAGHRLREYPELPPHQAAGGAGRWQREDAAASGNSRTLTARKRGDRRIGAGDNLCERGNSNDDENRAIVKVSSRVTVTVPSLLLGRAV